MNGDGENTDNGRRLTRLEEFVEVLANEAHPVRGRAQAPAHRPGGADRSHRQTDPGPDPHRGAHERSDPNDGWLDQEASLARLALCSEHLVYSVAVSGGGHRLK